MLPSSRIHHVISRRNAKRRFPRIVFNDSNGQVE